MPNNISSGFLLTRQAQDTSLGINITLWLKTQQGPVKLEVLNELAVFFIETKHVEYARQCLVSRKVNIEKITELSLKTFNQQDVSGFYFKFMRDFYAARESLKLQGIKCYEDDFRPDDRYLMERFITAGINFVGDVKTINHQNFLSLTNAKCKPQKCDIDLSMVSIDIECSMAGELYSIGFYSNSIQQVLMISDEKKITELSEDNKGLITWVDNEKQLLTAFIRWFKDHDVDIIIGWNVINFDMALLQKRCDCYGIKLALGRDGSAPYWRKNMNSEQSYIEIAGRVVLDGIDLLKTATYSFPSFSLDNVANTLLGIGKKVDDVENRVEEITYNFIHNKAALAAYNIEDCRLVWLIFEKTQLLDFAMLRAQLTGLTIDRMGGSVAAFTNLYLPKLHRNGYVAPNMGDGESDLISPGGYVMDSTPGLYENVLVLDFKSLYPSIIRTFKVDPMGLIEGLRAERDDQRIKGFDGAYFSKEHHFLPSIIETLWAERDKAKVDNNSALSQAIKIIMNSFYGVLGSTGCRFYDPRLSGSITKRSHELLKTTKHWIEEKGYQVIYGDTDSIFVHVGQDKSINDCNQLGKDLQKLINDKWQQVIEDDLNLKNHLEIEFETHFTRFLMPTVRGQSTDGGESIGTKKRYAGIVNKNNKSELVFKGMETVRSDWTQLSKDFQQELYRRVFNNEAVENYILETVRKTLNGEFDELLIYRKRLRRRLIDYVKNVPPHVKAARMADAKNERLNKPLKYQNKGWVEYLITLNGPQTKEYVNSALDYDFYVDRQLKAV
ncbi:MAG: DNA polymerase II, partial [Colwellia sp.]|nr:DNA polymerase II [Colwellia sp.]